MQYDVKTPEEYLRELDDDWRRETLLQLRQVLFAAAPGLTEGINYKMLSYSDERGTVFHLNAQKHYVSLYVGNAGRIDPGGELLEGLNVGKGCVRFGKSAEVAGTRIDEFVRRAIELRNQGEEFDC